VLLVASPDVLAGDDGRCVLLPVFRRLALPCSEAVEVVARIERQRVVLLQFADVVEAGRCRTVADVAVAWDACSARDGRCQQTACQRIGEDAAGEHVRGLLLVERARVVALGRQQVLLVGSHEQSRSLGQSQHLVAIAGPDGGRHDGAQHAGALHLQVQGSLLAVFQALQHALRLVILVDADGGDVVGTDVLRGQCVAAAQHVEALDVELVDVLALILDAPLLVNLHAGNLLYHVLDGAVALVLQLCDVVGDGVARGSDGRCLHGHLPEFQFRFLHSDAPQVGRSAS